MPGDWSRAEVEATVADYFAMLDAELRGLPYNKTEHRRALLRLLDDRSDGAVERKHGNISAILRELGHPWIDGYKPYGNYQQLLFDAVADRLQRDRALVEVIQTQASAPADAPAIDDLLALEEPPPDPDPRARGVREPALRPGDKRLARKVDFLALEARNASLGRAGEELVLRFEAERLHAAGRRRLADRIDHVSRTKGDGLGYDVLSFDADGKERLIEVKTTSFGKRTPFFVTRNEVACSIEERESYYLYRLFAFRKDPRLFTLQGRIDRTCTLDPVQYAARVA